MRHAPNVVAVLLFLLWRGPCHWHLAVSAVHHIDHRQHSKVIAGINLIKVIKVIRIRINKVLKVVRVIKIFNNCKHAIFACKLDSWAKSGPQCVEKLSWVRK